MKDALRSSIQWILQDHPVKCPNQTNFEMLLHIDILVERRCRSLLRPTEGLKNSGEGQTLMQQCANAAAFLPNSLARIIARRLD